MTELEYARRAAGLSQGALGRLAGLPQPEISKAERGEVGWEIAGRVRRALAAYLQANPDAARRVGGSEVLPVPGCPGRGKNPANDFAYGRRARDAARRMVRNAVRAGDLVRPGSCSACGRETPKIQGHHADYMKPLCVEWLCVPCHRSRHSRATTAAEPEVVAVSV